MIRFFDILISIFSLSLLLPLLVLISFLISIESKGSVIYRQLRVGRYGLDFYLFKFRTMYKDSYVKGALTIGEKDPRITWLGYYLRKYKLDELPQFVNVLFGDMSIVGPRPEVRKYVDYYTVEQQRILLIKPGITDYASIKYRNENKLLAGKANPEEYYITQIMPDKLTLNLSIVGYLPIKVYFKIIVKTVMSILGRC